MSDSCNTMDCILPGSCDHGIFQARILEWVEFPSLGDLPDPIIEPGSAALQVGFFYELSYHRIPLFDRVTHHLFFFFYLFDHTTQCMGS